MRRAGTGQRAPPGLQARGLCLQAQTALLREGLAVTRRAMLGLSPLQNARAAKNRSPLPLGNGLLGLGGACTSLVLGIDSQSPPGPKKSLQEI